MKRSDLAARTVVGLLAGGGLIVAAGALGGSTPAVEAEAILAVGVDLAPTGGPEERRLVEAVRAASAAAEDAAAIAVDYPLDESVFPPDMVAPRFLWHDPSAEADRWVIDVAVTGGRGHVFVLSPGPPPPAGEIDERAVGETNEVYVPTPYQASARSWEPSEAVWEAIKERSVEQPAVVTILGIDSSAPGVILSRGRVRVTTSEDPVGAPVFYRDVPLMPSRTEKNVIKPLAAQALPLIAWRLRDVSRPRSRVVLESMPTCANCHSFSADGRTLGMDMDGPDGDKGAYALAPIRPRMLITHDDVISWNSFKEKPKDHRTLGFLSRVSPDGQYAVTTLNEDLYVANFLDYRFLQVFYPTRGILAYYSTKSEEMLALPGASDPEYVHCDPAWSPDGRFIVFARAKARDSYTPGVPLATFPNDPNETPMQYGLYRMPFDGGKGGEPAPVVGASDNGMSNSFPKITPDGRFIVFVKSANGQLLRPDSELWIVPVEGGEARRMRCNTSLMNSWHSFSPNGRWMAFSSKANTPYTQMFLTHLDEEGRSTPPILVPDSTAANRAVNIPEFVNIAYDDLVTIEAPSVEHYRYFNRAQDQLSQNRPEEAIATLGKALELAPGSVKSHLLLGTALWQTGRAEEALAHYERAVELDPGRAETHYSLSFALFLLERNEEAIARFKRGFAVHPRWGRLPEEYDRGIALDLPAPPRVVVDVSRSRLEKGAGDMSAVSTLFVLATVRAAAREPDLRDGAEAVRVARQACAVTRYQIPEPIDVLAGAYAEAGRFDEAVRLAEFTVWFARAAARTDLVPGAEERLALYRQGQPFRRAD
ncbi:MAG: tetratricopeptide repeat protein [Acidobacteria bacterium]|nr:tetratricopeptide repeat protein [Acidobacteriota bacterium]